MNNRNVPTHQRNALMNALANKDRIKNVLEALSKGDKSGNGSQDFSNFATTINASSNQVPVNETQGQTQSQHTDDDPRQQEMMEHIHEYGVSAFRQSVEVFKENHTEPRPGLDQVNFQDVQRIMNIDAKATIENMYEKGLPDDKNNKIGRSNSSKNLANHDDEISKDLESSEFEDIKTEDNKEEVDPDKAMHNYKKLLKD